MTEAFIVIACVGTLLGGISLALLVYIVSRLKKLEETLLYEIWDTQELVADVICDMRKMARALNMADEDSDDGGGGER